MTPEEAVNIQRSAIDQNVPVTDLLRMLLATLNESDDDYEWAGLELAGYPTDREIPSYRVFPSSLQCLNPFYGWQPVRFSNPEHGEDFRTVHGRWGMVTIEGMGDEPYLELRDGMQSTLNRACRMTGEARFRLSLSGSQARFCLDQVRNRVLSIARRHANGTSSLQPGRQQDPINIGDGNIVVQHSPNVVVQHSHSQPAHSGSLLQGVTSNFVWFVLMLVATVVSFYLWPNHPH